MKKKLLLFLLLFLAALFFINFRWIDYLFHVARHQLAVVLSAEKIELRLERSDLSEKEKKLLLATLEIRRFAERLYGISNSKSYRYYFDTGRAYLGYNITVTPEFSLKPQAFSFWPIGSFDYLGFFSREKAESWAARYRAQGFDVHLSEFSGYSTLGWFEDPLYSTQLMLGEFALARLLGHEIAHERLYFKNDTTASELLASYIERRFALDYLAAHGEKVPSEKELKAMRRLVADFYARMKAVRDELEKLYASPLDTGTMRQRKKEIFAALLDELTYKNSKFKALPALRTLVDADALNNAWLVQFMRYAPQNAALDHLFLACRAKEKENAYTCWFNELDKLKECSKEKRKEWLQGEGVPLDNYCRQ